MKTDRRNFSLRLLFLRTEIDRIIMLSVLFSIALLMARIVYTRQLTFLFLVWNMFLAFVPYVLTTQFLRKEDWVENKLKFAVGFFMWLLFIPNSFYILTDLFHLGYTKSVPIWLDLAMILSFAWNGLILGILSVRGVERIVEIHCSPKVNALFIYVIMLMNSLGIYIGRYLRFNSWDVVTNPFDLMIDISKLVMHPFYYKNAWSMILCFSVFMTFAYFTTKKMSERNV